MSRAAKFIFFFAAAIVTVGYGIWWGLSFLDSTVKPRYAVEWTTLFIAEHLEANDRCWPIGWDELKDDFDRRGSGHYPFDFAELQTLVAVRWDVELPRDRELFSDGQIQVVQIPESNRFRSSLEPGVVQWNRELRDYVVGKPSRWLRGQLESSLAERKPGNR